MEQIRSQNIQNDPSVQVRIDEINAFTADYVQNFNPNEKALVVLPVVVHVIWNTAAQNITDAQINSQLTVLNKDFRKLNSNFSNTATVFQSIAADAEIQFCLAQVDPSGNPTTGITRTQTSVSNIGNTNNWYSTTNGGYSSWDVNKYVNIWVCGIGGGILGFATPPGVAVPASSDGLVVNPIYFGTSGTAANSAPNNLGRTATHELGHYFNLEHVWGPYNGGCSEDDYVTDTPNQNSENYGCPSFPLTDACTASGNGVNYNNYLDYVDDNCMTMFTVGQKARMRACIDGPRASLKASTACSGSSSASLTEITDEQEVLTIYPNPTSDKLTIALNPTSDVQEFSIVIDNVMGQVQGEFDINTERTIDVSNYPSGLYFVKSENYPTLTKRIIIQK